MTPTTVMSIRLGSFGGVLLAMAIWQWIAPRRRLSTSQPWRWGSNLGLVALNALLARVALPVTAVATAELAAAQGWGLLAWLKWPVWIEFVLAIVALDLLLYLQHVMFHAVPALWRLHLVHHADLDFDVSTGLRFHTLEILLSAVLKVAAVAALGPSAWAVLIFEVVLNATSMFNHSNVRMPLWFDRALRLVVVTPDMHRVHHSILRRETNSNFGFNLPWWDRLLGTYRDQPEAGHERMTIGLAEHRDERRTGRLQWMLVLPWTRDLGQYSIQPGDDRSDDEHSGT
ncbi:MAG: sterol desaturase family protein [Pirellulaceae bacterium]